ncbi:MAG: biotin synthase, partial [Gemmataceae bacterium]|nr:biotin synthase [Gemmataceae bacterium]
MKSLADIRAIYQLPFHELIWQAMSVHRAHHDPADIQRCALLSIKTGGCPEDCGYCSQSAHYDTGVPATPLMTVEDVAAAAR